MLGEAYSNGETEVRETITMVEEEGKGEAKVGSTLLSSPTVGRGRCPSIMTECLCAGFAFIMVGDRPGAHHKYMTGWHGIKCCCVCYGRKGEGYFVALWRNFVLCVSLSFPSFNRSVLPKVKWTSLPENMRHVCIIQWRVRALNTAQICKMIYTHTHTHAHTAILLYSDEDLLK